MRRRELWDSNPRLAERIEMRIKDAQRAHRHAHVSMANEKSPVVAKFCPHWWPTKVPTPKLCLGYLLILLV
jgi:hypothetical protein